jgi:hypothetical protein
VFIKICKGFFGCLFPQWTWSFLLVSIRFKVRVLVSHKLWQDILAAKRFGKKVCFVSGLVYPTATIGLHSWNLLRFGQLRQQFPADVPPLLEARSSFEQRLPRL